MMALCHMSERDPRGARSITVPERIWVFYGMAECFMDSAVLDLHETKCCLCHFLEILHQMPVMRGCSDTGAQKL